MATKLTDPVDSATKCEKLWKEDSARRSRYRALAVRHFQDSFKAGISSVTTVEVASAMSELATLAIGRSHVDAAVSKIAGVQRPRVQFVTTRADWKQRRVVDKLDQFNMGLFSSPCGQYPDIWALKQATARDAFMLGDGIEQVFFDSKLGRASFARRFPWEILVDQEDAKEGTPTQIWYRHPADKAASVEAWGSKAESSPSPDSSDFFWMPGMDSFVPVGQDNQIMVIEWWTRGDKENPGRHVTMDTNGVVFEEEDWPFDWFPFQTLHWCDPIIGFWGASLLEQSHKIEQWVNDVVGRIQLAVKNCAMNIVVTPKGVLTDPKNSFLTDNAVLEVNAEPGMPLPTVTAPQAFNPQMFEMVWKLCDKSFELTGVNQMSATAQKQPGIEANSAIQTMADLQSERFSVVWNNYQSSFVALSRKAIAITRLGLANEPDRKVSVAVPGDEFINSVDWVGADLDEDQFFIQLQTANSGKWTAADRVQQAENMAKGGMINPESLTRIYQYFDTPGEVSKLTRQDAYLSRMIDRWLDSTPEQRDSGLVRPDDENSPALIPAINKLIRLEAAIPLVGDAYLEAEFDEVPDDILELFISWLDMADQQLSQQAPPVPPAGQNPVPPEGMPLQ